MGRPETQPPDADTFPILAVTREYNVPEWIRTSGVLSVAFTHKVRFASLTDVGIKRSHNQDACAAQTATDDKHFRNVGHVFVVADGMGGHAVGEKASARAVGDIPLTFKKHVTVEGSEAAIRRAFLEANAGIHQIGTNNPEFKGLGTTSTALFLRPEGAWVGHVGDSRAYRIRGSQVEQLTFDHSWVWEIAKRQGVDPEVLGDFKKNVIIRSLGPEAEVEVDIEGPYPIEPGDQFLLCSDGLTNHVKPDELGAVVTAFPPAEACTFLVELANLRGGSDNITCLIVQVPSGDGNTTEIAPKRKQSSAVRALAWWESHVGWPITLLAVGGGLVGLAVWMTTERVPGSQALFILATMLTLAGLGGLALQLRRKVDSGTMDADAYRELHIYKTHTFEIEKELCERMQVQDELARKAIEEGHISVDQTAHSRLSDIADSRAKAGDWFAAFRARCQALQLLATPLNKHQHKDEEFKPNWTSPHNPVSG